MRQIWGSPHGSDGRTKMQVEWSKYISKKSRVWRLCGHSVHKEQYTFWKLPLWRNSLNSVYILKYSNLKEHKTRKQLQMNGVHSSVVKCLTNFRPYFVEYLEFFICFNNYMYFYTFVCGTTNVVLCEILVSCVTLVQKHSSNLPIRFMFFLVEHWHVVLLST